MNRSEKTSSHLKNEPNTKTSVSSCLSKKNLVYVETSNVLQLDISLSFERVKAKIKKKEKKKESTEYPSHCTQNRQLLQTNAGVTDTKQRKPGGQLTREIDISVQYIYIKYKI